MPDAGASTLLIVAADPEQQTAHGASEQKCDRQPDRQPRSGEPRGIAHHHAEHTLAVMQGMTELTLDVKLAEGANYLAKYDLKRTRFTIQPTSVDMTVPDPRPAGLRGSRCLIPFLHQSELTI